MWAEAKSWLQHQLSGKGKNFPLQRPDRGFRHSSDICAFGYYIPLVNFITICMFLNCMAWTVAHVWCCGLEAH